MRPYRRLPLNCSPLLPIPSPRPARFGRRVFWFWLSPASQPLAPTPLPAPQLLFGFGCNILSSDQFSAVDENMFYQVRLCASLRQCGGVVPTQQTNTGAGERAVAPGRLPCAACCLLCSQLCLTTAAHTMFGPRINGFLPAPY